MKLNFKKPLGLLKRVPTFSRKYKKPISLVVFTLVFIVFLVIINRLLFTSQLSSLDNSTNDFIAVLNETNAPTITSTQEFYIKNNVDSISISYPVAIARFAYPLSSDMRTRVDQVYKETEVTKTSLEALSSLSAIRSTALNVPGKDLLVTNTQSFISGYNQAIENLSQYKEVLDVSVVITILENIRDSAELYENNQRFDLFEARYDNVFSELEKELDKSLINYKSEVIDQVNALQNLINKF